MNRLRHTRQAIPWMAVVAAAAPGAGLLLVGLTFHDHGWAKPLVANGLLLLAIPAAFILDDPSTPVANATPRSPWWDLAGRLTVLWALCGLMAAVTWIWNRFEPSDQPWLLTLIPTCMAVLAVAGAALLRRGGRTSPGDALAGGLVFVILGLSLFRPTLRTWELMPYPGSASTTEAGIWMAAAALAVCLLAWAPSGRGPRAAADG